MINISLDLGNAPSVLAAMSNPQMAQHVANAAAEAYNDDVHHWIDAGRGFAVGHSVENRTEGSIQQQTNWRPLAGGAEIYSDASYAEFVEYGTGVFAGHEKWVINPIAPGKGLKIPVNTGEGYIVRRKVTHTGSRPHPFFFADTQNRQTNMGNAARSVLASYMAGGNNG